MSRPSSNLHSTMRLNGMKVIFDKPVPTTPINLMAQGKPPNSPTPVIGTDEEGPNTQNSPSNHTPNPSEQGKRLSQSIIWQHQRQFFERSGVKAWGQTIVPHYITSNPFIAKAYGKVILGYLEDWYGEGTGKKSLPRPTQPIYIIELGAGSGRFGYHFLKQFWESFQQSTQSTIPVKYVLTDLSHGNLEFWRTHPSLQPYFDRGVLDIARFDLEHDGQLTLEYSGDHLTADTLETPLIVLGNYVFGSIPQDMFTIKQGQLYETLVSTTPHQTKRHFEAPNQINRLDIAFDHRPLSSTNYYDDAAFNTILDYYQKNINDTSILFPIYALRCLDNLRHLAGDRLLILSADKGYSRESDLQNHSCDRLIPHGNCFFPMVNYHAIGQYISNQGGQVLQTPQHHRSLNILAFLFGHPPNGYGSTDFAYKDAIANHGPDDFYTLKKAVEHHFDKFTLKQLLSYLRLSGWDSKIFLDSYRAIEAKLDSVPEELRTELDDVAQQLWATHYPIGEPRNLAFHLGKLLYKIEYYTKALEYFQHALNQLGADPDIFFQMAQCHYGLGQPKAAVKYIHQALDLDSKHEEARNLRRKIQQQLK